MKNSLSDLNTHLFAQLERLSDEEISPENLQQEISRAKAITDVSREIISNASLVMKAHEMAVSGRHGDIPRMLGGGQ